MLRPQGADPINSVIVVTADICPPYSVVMTLNLEPKGAEMYHTTVRWGEFCLDYYLFSHADSKSYMTVRAGVSYWRLDMGEPDEFDYGWMFLLPVAMRQTITGFHAQLPLTIAQGPAPTCLLDAIKTVFVDNT